MRAGKYMTSGLALAIVLLTACRAPAGDDAAPQRYAPSDLPPAVAETRRTLLIAAQSGDLDTLRPILAEPDHFRFSYSVEPDPVVYWRDIRARRGGRPIMRKLAQALALPAARTDGGGFVWPYLASLPAQAYADLDPETAADVSLLMTRARWNESAATVGYTGYRLSIGAEGTWTGFIAGD
jgi:hypothetical protein